MIGQFLKWQVGHIKEHQVAHFKFQFHFKRPKSAAAVAAAAAATAADFAACCGHGAAAKK